MISVFVRILTDGFFVGFVCVLGFRREAGDFARWHGQSDGVALRDPW